MGVIVSVYSLIIWKKIMAQIKKKCPYDDCDNQINIPLDSEEADVIVCRTEGDKITGCNRNVELVRIERKNDDTIKSVELETLEVDEDWGE
jgi:hypothetical protein